MVGGHEHKSRRIQGPMGTRVNQIGTSKLVLDHPGIASQARRSRDAYGGVTSDAQARSNFLSPNRKLHAQLSHCLGACLPAAGVWWPGC